MAIVAILACIALWIFGRAIPIPRDIRNGGPYTSGPRTNKGAK